MGIAGRQLVSPNGNIFIKNFIGGLLVTNKNSETEKSPDRLEKKLFLFIPIFVACPFTAAQTRCPNPSVSAAGTNAAGFKRVPARKTTVVKIFWIIAVGAKPTA